MATALRQTYASFLRKVTEQVKDGQHLYLEMQDLLIELIGISGYLAFFDRPSQSPRPRIVEATTQYLRVLSKRKTGSDNVPTKTRLHAWGALSSIAQLHFYSTTDLLQDDNPVRHFRFDGVTPDAIAVGFILILRTWVRSQNGEHEVHCEGCERNEMPETSIVVLPVVLMEAALDMMAQISDDDDEVAKAIYSRLLHHQLEPLLQTTSLYTAGDAGALARKLLARVQGMSSEGDPTL
ncbi:hypothetical protein DICSQDRAFT_172501 [Dichomitus squalens LYAD-421 SS1]|uniref:Uncharacterized protein n=1 Tax=Dichomitus squalens (strain LYAD-421) TaxID=732165 RepID=R7STC9_DICSQ|nr:uncharacterized protein DICSQDRAFT_172501 [Dichomitus squalens LYAD-421 SS1]EJF59010.1 hypothetical protein DICSQDRAFT_172501 [Dichomitus squalens LYAD-421 SS1]